MGVVIQNIKKNNPSIVIVLLGSEKEPMLEGILDMRGRTTPSELNSLIKGAELHLGIDSYPTHIAGLLKKKVVALFSNTRAECTGPYSPDKGQFIAITPCARLEGCIRPCHMLWCACGAKDEGCMGLINPLAVVKAVEDMLV